MNARTPGLAERLFNAGTKVANVPFSAERFRLPEPITIDGYELDVVSDLVAFTQLPRTVVENEVSTRSRTSFRAEWHGTAVPLRDDHWFYLSTKGYLFANAEHFADREFLDRQLLPYLKPAGAVLDFGGGCGNLVLQLAACGFEASIQELSAIQRDFVRHRVRNSDLGARIQVLDWWKTAPVRSYDAVIAVDVLEHLPNARQVLDDKLIPCLRAGGVLIENSPFVINVANPMHHADYGFEEHMSEEGFTLENRDSDGTNVWRAGTGGEARR